jgi:hypothetical protein
VSKRIPQGMWRDTHLDKELRVLYYDSRSKCYRIEYLNMGGMRIWAAVEEFEPGKRFQSMGAWGLILRAKLDLRAGRPVLSARDFSLAGD